MRLAIPVAYAANPIMLCNNFTYTGGMNFFKICGNKSGTPIPDAMKQRIHDAKP